MIVIFGLVPSSDRNYFLGVVVRGGRGIKSGSMLFRAGGCPECYISPHPNK